MPRFLITRTVTKIEADTLDDAIQAASNRDAPYNVFGSTAWASVKPTREEQQRGEHYPVVIVTPIESAPWTHA